MSTREEIEQAKTKNRDKVLKMLQNKGVVTNKEFTKAQIGRFGASIKELRNEGYLIDMKRIPNSEGTATYTLRGKGEPIPQISATEVIIQALKEKGYAEVADKFMDILDEANVTVRNRPVKLT